MKAGAYDGLHKNVSKHFAPFAEELAREHADILHSIHISGSVVSGNYDPDVSDINSVVVLREMSLEFIEKLAPRGRELRKNRIAAPLIMTPEYINNSLDVFPVEFLNLGLIHRTVHGEDIFADIEVKESDLRAQCERELKVKLISLRQGYLSSMGQKREVCEGLARSLSDYMPLFRAIIKLRGAEPPMLREDVLRELGRVSGLDLGAYGRMLSVRREKRKLSPKELDGIFEEYYRTTESLMKQVDSLAPEEG